MIYIKSYRIFENIQQAKSILTSLDIPESDKPYLKIGDLLKSNIGYVGWFTKMFYENGVNLESL